MFCKECGAPAKDGARFCEYCGAKLDLSFLAQSVTPEESPATSETTPETVTAPTPTESTPDAPAACPTQSDQPLPAVDLVRPFLRRMTRSAWIWITVAALLFTALLPCISAIMIPPEKRIAALWEQVDDSLWDQNVFSSDTIRETLHAPEIEKMIGSASIVGETLSAIPKLLFGIGLLMAAISLSQKSAKASSAGISLMKGVLIYRLVILCIVFSLILIPILVAVFYSILQGNAASVAATLLILFFAALIATPFILYYAFFIRTLNAIRYSVRTSLVDLHISRYVAVIHIILGVCSFTSVAFAASPTNALLILANTAVYLCSAIFLFTYRSHMEDLSKTPVYRQFAAEHN